MSTLLLRFAGPLQSWGAEAKFETRRTLGFPTKSGVIGLLAAALGRTREEPLDDLNNLKFGVRVDKEGNVIKDFHIAKSEKDSYITERYYLSDAIFLVGVESDDIEFIKKLEFALKTPAFPLFLGRRSCPPTQPLLLGVRDKELLECLKSEPWLLEGWRIKRLRDKSQYQLRIIIDDDSPFNMSILKDKALSFSPKHRQFGWRAVKDYGYLNMLEHENINKQINPTEHNPLVELR